jgi:hypothetical protein
VGSGVGSGVGWGVGVISTLGSTLTLGDGSVDAGGQGRAATSDPLGDGITNDGTTPLGSGVGIGKQLGDGLGEPQPLPVTNGPQVFPYGVNEPL